MLPLLALTLAAPPDLLNAPFDATAAGRGRAAWAVHLGVPESVTDPAGGALVLIPPGRFTAGPDGSTSRVTLAKAFYIGTTEVTLGQYRRFRPGHRIAGAADAANADDRPAAMVSWHDAQAYCGWLSERAKGRVYVLPTAARWEWACRAGSAGPRPFAGDPRAADGPLAEYAWFNRTYTPNPERETAERGRQPVGRLRPNAWGLHDTLGNVWEWTADRPADPETGEERQPLTFGGSWRSGGFHCTAVAHDPMDANARADNVGFRVSCGVPVP